MKKLMILLVLAMLVSTVFAQEGTVITPENASELTELVRLGRGKPSQLAYSPDGSTIAVASSIGVWLYSADSLDTEQEPPYIVSSTPVTAVAFSPDGNTLAFGEDGVLRLWDMEAMAETNSMDLNTTLNFIKFSPDGSVIATNGSEYKSVALINTDDLSVKPALVGHSSNVRSAAFSPDGSTLITGADSGDNIIRVWDVADGTESATVEGHTSNIKDLDFGEGVIVSGSADYSVKIWDAEGTEVATLKPADVSYFYVYSVDLSPDGSKVAVGTSNAVYVWNADGSGDPTIFDLEGAGDINDLEFSPDGTQLVTLGYNRAVRLWDVESGSEIAAARGHTDNMTSVAFSPDGDTLIVGSNDDFVWLWDTAARTELHLSPTMTDALGATSENVTYAAFAPDGSVAGTVDGFGIKLWNPATGDLVAELEGDGLSNSLAFSPDSSLVAYVGSEGVFVFDVASQELLTHLTGHTEWAETIAFSPDQTLLVTGASDGTVRVWGLAE